MKMLELEGIDVPAVPLAIVLFTEEVPTVLLWEKLGAYAKNAPE